MTISREYGAAGLAVAEGLARNLGYALLADDVQRAVAERLGTTENEIASRAGAGTPLGEKLLTGLGLATAEGIPLGSSFALPDFDETVRREIERTVRERALAGDVVVVGRGAAALLSSRPDLVSVFLLGAKRWRIARLVEAHGITAEQASRDIDRVDGARKALSRDRYKMTWGDPHAYDVVCDVSRLGIEATVATIAAAVRAKEANA